MSYGTSNIMNKVFYSYWRLKRVSRFRSFKITNYIVKIGGAKDCIRGHPFMTSTKNLVFDPLPLSTCVHMGRTPSPLWTSTRGRHEIHTTLLKWLVQRPTGPKTEIRLYDSNLFKLYY